MIINNFMNDTARNRRLYSGIFLTSFCLLMYEITLTRIFSVAMWFHFAFLAISLSLLGIGASGIFVHFLSQKLDKEKCCGALCLFSFLFSCSIILSYLFFLGIPFVPRFSAGGLMNTALICLTVSFPFFLGGVCLSLSFYFFRENISRLYFYDLLGGSTGCLSIVLLLHLFRAPTVIVLISCFACIGTYSFSSFSPASVFRRLSAILCAALLLFALFDAKTNALRVDFVKGAIEDKGIYEKWNSFSRIVVTPRGKSKPYAWGLSPTFKGGFPESMRIHIDLSAGTPLIRFSGNLKEVAYLKYDIPSLVHYVKKANDIFIIGPGGGKDVLAARLFDVKNIYGAELNPLIVNIVNKEFADFSGALYLRQGIHIQADEGRSALARQKKQFDIVQASLIDTQAATAAGAYVLSESNLYTVEAFKDYLMHLKSDGILTFTRSYFDKLPAESLRLLSLGMEALHQTGAKDIDKHFLIAKIKWTDTPGEGPDSYAVFLIKKTPFTDNEARRFESAVSSLGFNLVYSPLSPALSQPEFKQLLETQNLSAFCNAYPLNICPPTDEKPFFFYALRLKDMPSIIVNRHDPIHQGATGYNIKAILVLGMLFVVVTALACATMLFPLLFRLSTHQGATRFPYRLLLYFSCLGLAFMMVEVPLIQKFNLFLGYPVYSLSVILFSLLLFSGIGSFTTQNVLPEKAKKRLLLTIPCLLAILVVCTLFSTSGFYMFMGKPRFVKCMLTVVFLAPLGFFMGMPFPLGIKILSNRAPEAIPWAWAMNGIFSVCASVFSIVVSLNWGITTAIGLGGLGYVTALLLLFGLNTREQDPAK